MSRKSQREGFRSQWKEGVYKLIDDRSGFYIYSDQIVIDHRGRITTKNNFDPIHPTEMKIKFPEENFTVKHARPEGDTIYFLDGTTLDNSQEGDS